LICHNRSDKIIGMTLAEYLIAKKMSDAEFGRLVNLPRQTIQRYRRNESFPRLAHLNRLHIATGGLVTANDFAQAARAAQARALQGAE
jgi:transcriptional regulator with XRE-family HTH domain